jgi:hypothetical protein
MKATLLYRIASVLFFLFGIGHTYGFLTFLPSSAEGRSVFQAMQEVHFREHGANLSYGEFYRGFGVSLGIQLFFSSYLAWYMGDVARNAPGTLGLLGWVFCAAQLVGLAMNFKSFAPPAAIFGLLLSLCLGWAAWLAGKSVGVPTPR